MWRKHGRAYLLLILSGICLLFANGRWAIPVMAWLYPPLMLRVTRRMKPWSAYLHAALTIAICSQISFLDFASSNPANPRYYLPAAMGLVLALPYTVDRLLYGRMRGLAATLAFPATYVVVEYFYSMNPLGSTGVLGYSQFGALALSQLVSITGIWGLTFLIAWTASVLNWACDQYANRSSPKRELLVYATVILAVLLYGGVRLQGARPSETVKITGLHVYDLRGAEGQALWQAEESDWELFRRMSAALQERFFAATETAAKDGAKFVVWSEIAPPLAEDDEATFIQRAGQVAKDESIYLVTSPYICRQGASAPDENKLMIFDPTGALVLTHYKYGGNLIEGTLRGDGVIRTVDTPYGRISGIICWDQDFPNIVRQAGQKQVDILFAPSADWLEITPLHSAVGYFRAIENGYSLVRQDINGLSIISDGKGRVLASTNHFTSTEWVTTANVPIRGQRTIYPQIGDALPWMCIGLILWMGIAEVWNVRVSSGRKYHA